MTNFFNIDSARTSLLFLFFQTLAYASSASDYLPEMKKIERGKRDILSVRFLDESSTDWTVVSSIVWQVSDWSIAYWTHVRAG